MPTKYIVPVDSETEKNEYVKKMYCENCKAKGGVKIEFFKDVIEEGYHYEVARCICDQCNRSFDVRFFPTSSCINKKINAQNDNLSNYSL